MANSMANVYNDYENSDCKAHPYANPRPLCPHWYHPIDTLEFLDNTGIYDGLKDIVHESESYFKECLMEDALTGALKTKVFQAIGVAADAIPGVLAAKYAEDAVVIIKHFYDLVEYFEQDEDYTDKDL